MSKVKAILTAPLFWLEHQLDILHGWLAVSIWLYKLLWQLCRSSLIWLSIVVALNSLSVFLVGKSLEWTLDEIKGGTELSVWTLALPITLMVGAVWILERFLKTLTIVADTHVQDYFGSYFPNITMSWGMVCFDGGNRYFEMLSRGKRAEYSLGFFVPQQFRLLTNVARWLIGIGILLKALPQLWWLLLGACTVVLYMQIRSSVRFTQEDRRTWNLKAERTDMKKVFDYKLRFKAALAFGIGEKLASHVVYLGTRIYPPIRRWAWYLLQFELLSIVALVGVSYYAINEILQAAISDPSMSVGKVAFLITTMTAVGYSLQMIVNIVADQAKGADSLVDLVRYDARKDSAHKVVPGGRLLAAEDPGTVCYEHFSFSYDTRRGEEKQVVRDVSFSFPGGEVTYLLGKNGAGKTTLINTLGRLYEPEKGQVFVADVDVLDIQVGSLRSFARQMPQTPIELRLTFRQILAFAGGYSNPADCPEESMWQALQMACLDKKVGSFRRRLDEPLGVWNNASEDLSGGQWRLTNFAMFFMAYLTGTSKILILDEPWVNIDPRTSNAIQERLFSIDATIIIISHEVHRIRNEDNVVFLDAASEENVPTSTVFTGTHKELCNNAKYREYCGFATRV